MQQQCIQQITSRLLEYFKWQHKPSILSGHYDTKRSKAIVANPLTASNIGSALHNDYCYPSYSINTISSRFKSPVGPAKHFKAKKKCAPYRKHCINMYLIPYLWVGNQSTEQPTTIIYTRAIHKSLHAIHPPAYNLRTELRNLLSKL